MNLWKDLEPGTPEKFLVVIEIPKGSSIKYEYDHEKGVFELDRVLYSAQFFPGDYGLIPQTWSEDEDPMDVLILVTYPSFPGCVMKVRPVALLEMEDEKGVDNKIVAVPVKDPRFDHMKDVNDIPEHTKKEITEFLQTYKNLEPGKWVKLREWKSAEEAKKVIKECMERFKEKFGE